MKIILTDDELISHMNNGKVLFLVLRDLEYIRLPSHYLVERKGFRVAEPLDRVAQFADIDKLRRRSHRIPDEAIRTVIPGPEPVDYEIWEYAWIEIGPPMVEGESERSTGLGVGGEAVSEDVELPPGMVELLRDANRMEEVPDGREG